ncbi:hypothetical protein [Mesoterricola sediminis]|uniref:Uncharacterized protein n=1 Tax=Mesoterricola sediminis TaxID=2927980 RepID=A0AA48GSP2_9BACT|nr:hypothetical protein [Mesoterricola sediminis]BDU75464.1 hypothetical protein METESE_04220 [Mesoterricola sediminis]
MPRSLTPFLLALAALAPAQAGTFQLVNRSQGTWTLSAPASPGGSTRQVVLRPGEVHAVPVATGEARFLVEDGRGQSLLALRLACAPAEAEGQPEALRADVVCTEARAEAWAPAVIRVAEAPDSAGLEVAFQLDAWPDPAAAQISSPALSPTTAAQVDQLLGLRLSPLQVPDAPRAIPDSSPAPAQAPALAEDLAPLDLPAPAAFTRVWALPGESLLDVAGPRPLPPAAAPAD